MSSQSYTDTIRRVSTALETHLDTLLPNFSAAFPLLTFVPTPSRWSIGQILEHVTLTNHFLLLVIEKQVRRALKRAAQGHVPPPSDSFTLEPIEDVGRWGAFTWIRPSHMEPSPSPDLPSVQNRLVEQKRLCLALLENTSSGEGALVTVRPSVNDLGRLNMYQWLYFLAQHARRHGTQILQNQASYKQL